MASSAHLSASDVKEPSIALCERLAPRQRECLRHVYRLKTSKEIALELGLGVGTVDTYISEAVAILRARNRRHAAELFHAFEDAAMTPRKMQLENTGVGTGQADEPPEKAEPPPTSWVRLLPLRTMGVSANDLDPYLRYFWLVFLAIALALARIPCAPRGSGRLLTALSATAVACSGRGVVLDSECRVWIVARNRPHTLRGRPALVGRVLPLRLHEPVALRFGT